ncbi:hypothetical protein N9L11_01500 [Euryarchaeota archaeon]|nr:hypothetical protein [Euryarchaeota archaeon]
MQMERLSMVLVPGNYLQIPWYSKNQYLVISTTSKLKKISKCNINTHTRRTVSKGNWGNTAQWISAAASHRQAQAMQNMSGAIAQQNELIAAKLTKEEQIADARRSLLSIEEQLNITKKTLGGYPEYSTLSLKNLQNSVEFLLQYFVEFADIERARNLLKDIKNTNQTLENDVSFRDPQILYYLNNYPEKINHINLVRDAKENLVGLQPLIEKMDFDTKKRRKISLIVILLFVFFTPISYSIFQKDWNSFVEPILGPLLSLFVFTLAVAAILHPSREIQNVRKKKRELAFIIENTEMNNKSIHELNHLVQEYNAVLQKHTPHLNNNSEELNQEIQQQENQSKESGIWSNPQPTPNYPTNPQRDVIGIPDGKGYEWTKTDDGNDWYRVINSNSEWQRFEA